MDEVEKLIKALGDQDDAVRANAVEALVQTGEPAVEPPCQRNGMWDEDWNVRMEAADNVLTALGYL